MLQMTPCTELNTRTHNTWLCYYYSTEICSSWWTTHRTVGKKANHSWNYLHFHSKHLEFIRIVQILDKGCLNSLKYLEGNETNNEEFESRCAPWFIPLLTLHKFQPVWQSFLSVYKVISVRWQNIRRKQVRKKWVTCTHWVQILILKDLY